MHNKPTSESLWCGFSVSNLTIIKSSVVLEFQKLFSQYIALKKFLNTLKYNSTFLFQDLFLFATILMIFRRRLEVCGPHGVTLDRSPVTERYSRHSQSLQSLLLPQSPLVLVCLGHRSEMRTLSLNPHHRPPDLLVVELHPRVEARPCLAESGDVLVLVVAVGEVRVVTVESGEGPGHFTAVFVVATEHSAPPLARTEAGHPGSEESQTQTRDILIFI